MPLTYSVCDAVSEADKLNCLLRLLPVGTEGEYEAQGRVVGIGAVVAQRDVSNRVGLHGVGMGRLRSGGEREGEKKCGRGKSRGRSRGQMVSGGAGEDVAAARGPSCEVTAPHSKGLGPTSDDRDEAVARATDGEVMRRILLVGRGPAIEPGKVQSLKVGPLTCAWF